MNDLYSNLNSSVIRCFSFGNISSMVKGITSKTTNKYKEVKAYEKNGMSGNAAYVDYWPAYYGGLSFNRWIC